MDAHCNITHGQQRAAWWWALTAVPPTGKGGADGHAMQWLVGNSRLGGTQRQTVMAPHSGVQVKGHPNPRPSCDQCLEKRPVS